MARTLIIGLIFYVEMGFSFWTQGRYLIPLQVKSVPPHYAIWRGVLWPVLFIMGILIDLQQLWRKFHA